MSPLAEEQLMAATEGNFMFFKNVAPERPPTLWYMDPPMYHNCTINWLRELKQKHKWSWERGDIRRDGMRVDLIKTHNIHVQNPQTIKRLIKNIFYQDKMMLCWRKYAKFHSQLKATFMTAFSSAYNRNTPNCQIIKKTLLGCQDLGNQWIHCSTKVTIKWN